VTFCAHDSFEDEPGSLINLAATLKSPEGLVDTFLKAIIRTKKPLSYKEVMVRYDDCLQHIQGDAQLNMIKGQHLSQWHSLLFGNNPIDLGLPMDKYQKRLTAANPGVKDLLDNPWTDHTNSFFHHTKPTPFGNQQAILTLVGELARVGKKNTFTYVHWSCGYGKTTCLMEMGNVLAQASLAPKSKNERIGRLVLANADLVGHYKQLFTEKEK